MNGAIDSKTSFDRQVRSSNSRILADATWALADLHYRMTYPWSHGTSIHIEFLDKRCPVIWSPLLRILLTLLSIFPSSITLPVFEKAFSEYRSPQVLILRKNKANVENKRTTKRFYRLQECGL